MFDKATFIKPETKVYIEERRPRRNEMPETTIPADRIMKAVQGALAAIGKDSSKEAAAKLIIRVRHGKTIDSIDELIVDIREMREKEAEIFLEKWT